MNKGIMLKIDKAIQEASEWYGVPVDRLRAHAWDESHYGEFGDNPRVVSSDQGKGVMQITVGYHKMAEDPAVFDINLNVNYAAWMLSGLYHQYNDWKLASKAYNGSGPAADAYTLRIDEYIKTQPWIPYLK